MAPLCKGLNGSQTVQFTLFGPALYRLVPGCYRDFVYMQAQVLEGTLGVLWCDYTPLVVVMSDMVCIQWGSLRYWHD